MARILDHFASEPRSCAYLPAETASLEYRLMVDVSPADLDHLLERGWRRFGVAYFRPVCGGCSECVPLRVPVAGFEPSRAQKRVERGGRAIRLEIGLPCVDEARMALYAAWHHRQARQRGWPDELMTAEQYFHEFAFPHPSVREFAYYDDAAEGGPRLVAVAIVDETPRALSAVYTYHHPDYRRWSLGTLSILRQLEVARGAGKRWLYLGYRVLGCPSSEYKAKFRPQEILAAWPGLRDPAVWRPYDVDAPETARALGIVPLASPPGLRRR